MEMRKR